MPAITYGYLPVVTRVLAAATDKVNFATTIATQGLYTQGGTPLVTDFVEYQTDPGDGATVTGVSVRINYAASTPSTKSTISVFSVDSETGTITALNTPLLDTGTASHEVSVPLTVPTKLTSKQSLKVFVSGQTGGTMTLSGCEVSFVPGP